jgi:replicative DNA helicase
VKLSAPLYHLKRQARILSRERKIPLHEALDQIAAGQGYAGWSLLAARVAAASPAARLFARLVPGDLLLIGARPGHGKTLLSLELAVEAMKSGNRATFFTLEYTIKEVLDRFRSLGVAWANYKDLFGFDDSDAISAGYVMEKLATQPRGSLAVIDYLQLLDQKRENPDLASQVHALKAFARERELILVFIAQIARSYDPSTKPLPDIGDIRLPNQLDTAVFSKTCFLNDGELRFAAAG